MVGIVVTVSGVVVFVRGYVAGMGVAVRVVAGVTVGSGCVAAVGAVGTVGKLLVVMVAGHGAGGL